MKKLRVFEAFSGIGAQHAALERIGINYEIVGTCDWFINAILAYDAIHNDKHEEKIPSKKEQLKYLSNFTFSKDSVNPIKDLSRLSDNEIENLYIANKRSKNYGSIIELHGNEMPKCDLLVYSFPCQDLSTGGLTKGMKKGSGTRSGLLWEIERILKELKKLNQLPEYLLMENVKAIYAPSNASDLKEWLDFLESIGYVNGSKLVLNAKNFGVPQDRNRAFIISHLKSGIDDSSLLKIRNNDYSFFDFYKNNYKDPVLKTEANEAQLNNTISRKKMWDINQRDPITEKTIVNTITCNMDRSNTAAMFDYKGPKGHTFRLLTIREAFLLMGFTEDEYEKAKSLGLSYRKMNKLIGNSIVVNVLAAIFELLFKEKYGKRDSNA